MIVPMKPDGKAEFEFRLLSAPDASPVMTVIVDLGADAGVEALKLVVNLLRVSVDLHGIITAAEANNKGER